MPKVSICAYKTGIAEYRNIIGMIDAESKGCQTTSSSSVYKQPMDQNFAHSALSCVARCTRPRCPFSLVRSIARPSGVLSQCISRIISCGKI